MKISLVRDTSVSSKNVGDFWIGEGVLHLMNSWADSRSIDVYYNSMDVYQRRDDDWFLSDNNSDMVVRCGTPHLNDTDLSKNFTSHFHAKLQSEKDKGKTLIEIGPGQDFGIPLVMMGYGAKAILVDKYLCSWDDAFHPHF